MDRPTQVPSTSNERTTHKTRESNVQATRKVLKAGNSRKNVKDKPIEEDLDNVSCLICCSLYRYPKYGEIWVQRGRCKDWAHEECADARPLGEEWTCI